MQLQIVLRLIYGMCLEKVSFIVCHLVMGIENLEPLYYQSAKPFIKCYNVQI